MEKKEYQKIAKVAFTFLESEFGCKLIKKNNHSWGYELIYKNNTTGVKILNEYRENYLFISLCKLINGQIIDDPIIILNNSKLNCFGLDDIILLKKSVDLMNPLFTYPNDSKYKSNEDGYSKYINDFSKNLKIYGKEVLNGDFSIFKDVERVVRSRVEKYNN